MPAQEERARPAGWAGSTFRRRMNRKGDGGGMRVDRDEEAGGEDEHYGQEDEVGRGHGLVYWERKNGKHMRQGERCQMHAAKYVILISEVYQHKLE